MTASLRAVADIADTRPFLCDILEKKFDKAVSFKLPIAFAAFLSAVLSRLLPFGILLLKGSSINQTVDKLVNKLTY